MTAAPRTRTLDPVLKFDAERQAGETAGARASSLYPHGIFVNRDRHIWLVEGMSPERRGRRCDPRILPRTASCCAPWASAALPAHRPRSLQWRFRCAGGAQWQTSLSPTATSNKTNNRILKYDHSGKFLQSDGASWARALASSMRRTAWPWTRKAGFMSPTVPTAASRSSTRTGKFPERMAAVRPAQRHLSSTKDDMIYVADSLSSAQNNPGFKNGIRWGQYQATARCWASSPGANTTPSRRWRWTMTGNIFAGFTNVPNFRKFTEVRSVSP